MASKENNCRDEKTVEGKKEKEIPRQTATLNYAGIRFPVFQNNQNPCSGVKILRFLTEQMEFK